MKTVCKINSIILSDKQMRKDFSKKTLKVKRRDFKFQISDFKLE